VGVRNALRLVSGMDPRTGQLPAPLGGPGRPVPQILSPWQSGQLTAIVWADLIESDLLPATRAEAVQLPALLRGRNLICSTIAQLPLEALRLDVPTDPQPSWMQRTDGYTSPYHRMVWTVDDLIMFGWSLWAVDRGADGFPIAAQRVPMDWWQFDTDARTVLVSTDPGNAGAMAPVDAASVVLIPSMTEGILNTSGRTIRSAALLDRSAAAASANPTPVIELHQLTDDALEPDEQAKLIADWSKAVTSGGGVAYTNAAVEARDHGAQPENLLITGRNAAAVDIARILDMPAALLDATTAGASLTYETTTGRNQEWLDYGLSAYMAAIAGRLSQDDVLPRGQRAAFDTTTLTAPNTTPTGAPAAD
jgi:Phage portal protein